MVRAPVTLEEGIRGRVGVSLYLAYGGRGIGKGSGMDGEVGSLAGRKEGALNARKEISVGWSEEQRDRLDRSLLGICVKPIDFRKTINQLLDDWTGSGEIECKDVGPYRCLITFSSPGIKDEAMKDAKLLSVFDELKPHWEFFSSLSRRVWIEIMGLPVELWCNETFNSFAKLWGKLIKMDNRIEESKSFTMARFLVDCFQWESSVHEWITMKVDDKVFEVFAKEFGSEVYNVQSHPDLEEVCSTSMEVEEKPNSVSVVVRTPADSGELSAGIGHSNSKFLNVDDPLLEFIINCRSKIVDDLVNGGVIAEVEIGESAFEEINLNEISGSCLAVGVGNGSMGLDPKDPMIHEAKLASIKSAIYGPRDQDLDSNGISDMGADSTNSCPYPPGFELFVVQAHVNRVDTRVPEFPQIECGKHGTGAAAVVKGDTGLGHSPSGSDDVFHLQDQSRLHSEPAVRSFVGDYEEAVPIVVVLPTENKMQEDGYLGYSLVHGVSVANPSGLPVNGVSAANPRDSLNFNVKDADRGINNSEVDKEDPILHYTDVVRASGEEEEVLTRLAERKIVGKGRVDLRQKKQKQGRKSPCLEGRTLATRTLRLASKTKLK
ncbi:hypothetical protein PIB30_047214 [Stylosanthes scabra]|uniref:DUF4283 domain-containing protein n=1 Tax=Stylosanthes scabra TaxID=79078 RepID=A0ABU6UJZ8_9FABA|nr:hypothetical protein [Stylosanthes scabra]